MAGPRGLVRPGGLLLVAADWAWAETVCPPQLWLGGRGEGQQQGGEGQQQQQQEQEQGGAQPSCQSSSRQGLAAALGPAFQLVKEAELPCLLRQSARQFQVTLVQASVWRRVE